MEAISIRPVHDHHRGHADHRGPSGHDRRRVSKRSLIIAPVLKVGYALADIIGGVLAGSLVLLAHAGHLMAAERVDYPSKNRKFCLNALSKTAQTPSDLVANFFCGSGTPAVVAEELGRQWICTDLARASSPPASA